LSFNILFALASRADRAKLGSNAVLHRCKDGCIALPCNHTLPKGQRATQMTSEKWGKKMDGQRENDVYVYYGK
jgi:hypothetical protein